MASLKEWESHIGNFISQHLKTDIGKGPEYIRATITGSCILIYCRNIMTTLESKLLQDPVKGKDLVIETRRVYRRVTEPERIKELESWIGLRIVDSFRDWNLENNSSMYVLMFERELPEWLEQRSPSA